MTRWSVIAQLIFKSMFYKVLQLITHGVVDILQTFSWNYISDLFLNSRVTIVKTGLCLLQ